MLLLSAPTALAGEQTASEAREADAAIIASARGWTQAEVLSLMDDQQTFAELAGDVQDAYPSDYSSGVFAASPTASSQLYFKGSVPSGVAAMISASGLSVTTHGNTGKNFTEWRQQYEDVVAFLDSESYASYVVAFDSINAIEVLIGNGAPLPTLPDEIDDDVTVTGTSGAVVVDHAAVRGGSEMYDNSAPMCTSSWNVEEQGTGNRGTVTAGHCGDLDEVDDINGSPVSTTWQAEHIGTHGDFEWHTTPSNEPARFWADAQDWREVKSVKTWFFRNDWACSYGRSSNVRTCDQVYRTSVAVAGGVKHLTLMDGTNTTFGDSGGGWSWGTEAIGVHKGVTALNGAWRDTYSKGKRIDNALGVDVRIAP